MISHNFLLEISISPSYGLTLLNKNYILKTNQPATLSRIQESRKSRQLIRMIVAPAGVSR